MADGVSFDIIVAATRGRQANFERKSSIQQTLGRRRSRRMRRQGPNTKSFYGKATPRACVKSMQEREDLARCVAQSFVVPLRSWGRSHFLAMPRVRSLSGLRGLPRSRALGCCSSQHTPPDLCPPVLPPAPPAPPPAFCCLPPTLCHPLFANRPLPPHTLVLGLLPPALCQTALCQPAQYHPALYTPPLSTAPRRSIFNAADEDNDAYVNKEEFASLLHALDELGMLDSLEARDEGGFTDMLDREYGLVDVSGKGTIDFNAFVTFYNKLVNHQLMNLVNKHKNLQWTEMGEFEKASAADFFSCTTEQKLGYLRLGQKFLSQEKIKAGDMEVLQVMLRTDYRILDLKMAVEVRTRLAGTVGRAPARPSPGPPSPPALPIPCARARTHAASIGHPPARPRIAPNTFVHSLASFVRLLTMSPPFPFPGRRRSPLAPPTGVREDHLDHVSPPCAGNGERRGKIHV